MSIDHHELCREHASRIEDAHRDAVASGLRNPVVLVFESSPKVSLRSREALGGSLAVTIGFKKPKLPTCHILAVPCDDELERWLGLSHDFLQTLRTPAQPGAFFALVVSKECTSIVEFRSIAVDFFPVEYDCLNRLPWTQGSPI